MPRAPKQCGQCGWLVIGRAYCPEHQPIGWRTSPSARNRTHTRDDLRAFRIAVLKREPRCRVCGAEATEADHIVPVSRGGTNDADTNGAGLCAACHQAKTRAEARGRSTPSPRP